MKKTKKFKGFEYEDGRLVDTAYLDGYSFGDRILEGVMFKCQIVRGKLQVSTVDDWDTSPYLTQKSMNLKEDFEKLSSPVRVGVLLAGALAMLLGVSNVFTIAANMVSSPNTPAVWMGTLLILLCIVGVFCVGDFVVKHVKTLLTMAIALYISGCTYVPPGYVGVRVNLTGTGRGVDNVTAVTGRVFYNPVNTEIHIFPAFMQQAMWTVSATEGKQGVDEHITFNSVEGSTLHANVFVAYQMDPDKIPALFAEFRKDEDYIQDVYMRGHVRDALDRVASTMRAADVFGEKKTLLLKNALGILREELGPKGFIFDSLSFQGSVWSDPQIMASINNTIMATQRAIEAENAVREKRAQAEQAVATAEGAAKAQMIQAQAQADANKIVAASITPELIEWQRTQRWNGVLPQATGGAIPMLNMNNGK